MMDKVLTGVAIAFALGVLAFFFAPLRTKLERKRMIVAGDHGIRVVVSSTPDQLSGVASADMLGMKPGWLLPSTFFVPWDRPPGEARRAEARPGGGGRSDTAAKIWVGPMHFFRSKPRLIEPSF